MQSRAYYIVLIALLLKTSLWSTTEICSNETSRFQKQTIDHVQTRSERVFSNIISIVTSFKLFAQNVIIVQQHNLVSND